MNWFQRISQVNNLNQMLISVAQGVQDVGSVAQYVSQLAPAPPDVCEMINAVGASYPGSEASMGRIARAAGCQFNPTAGDDPSMMMPPGVNPMFAPAEKSMEMPSIEIE